LLLHDSVAGKGVGVADSILEMKGIDKSFGGVRALRDVNFTCRKGEVHALVGENGAGKSTLMKILAGALQPDRGEVSVRGTRVRIDSPEDAQALGVSIIYQEFNLLSYLTVVDNIFLGRERRSMPGFVDFARSRREANELLGRLGLQLDVDAQVGTLSVAQCQMVEIAKALSLNAEIIVMDEPSAVLAGAELHRLFEIITNLQSQGVTVVYISHRLDEVFEIADRCTVLKDGELVGTLDIGNTTKGEIIRMMVGRELSETFPAASEGIGDPVLEVRGLCSASGVRNVSFTLHQREVLGIAGMVGSGRTELARAIFGADPLTSGEIFVRGKRAHIGDPKDGVGCGMALVPEDRKTQGLVLGLTIQQNFSLPLLDRLSHFGLINRAMERAMLDRSIRELRIKAARVDQPASSLSGGNQQKVVLAKWLAAEPDIIILDEPTRGIDVGAKAEIYALVRELAGRGKAILMISSELPEILGMSDRILVMHKGGISGELSRHDATEEKVLTLATGQPLEAPA
jgi:ribose transport system ATP-binding protein